LRISLVAVPVKAFPAVSSATTSHFHLLHAECGQRIQYNKSCPQHGPVTTDAIVQELRVLAQAIRRRRA
jgi:non-homologous end joining protein Ku